MELYVEWLIKNSQKSHPAHRGSGCAGLEEGKEMGLLGVFLPFFSPAPAKPSNSSFYRNLHFLAISGTYFTLPFSALTWWFLCFSCCFCFSYCSASCKERGVQWSVFWEEFWAVSLELCAWDFIAEESIWHEAIAIAVLSLSRLILWHLIDRVWITAFVTWKANEGFGQKQLLERTLFSLPEFSWGFMSSQPLFFAHFSPYLCCAVLEVKKGLLMWAGLGVGSWLSEWLSACVLTELATCKQPQITDGWKEQET